MYLLLYKSLQRWPIPEEACLATGNMLDFAAPVRLPVAQFFQPQPHHEQVGVLQMLVSFDFGVHDDYTFRYAPAVLSMC